MMEQREIRIEARLRNNILWHAIFDIHKSVAEFCREYKINEVEVGKLLNLSKSPFREKGGYRDMCIRIADAVGIMPEDLFPPRLYGFEKTQVAFEFAFAELPAGGKELLALASPHDPLAGAVRQELADNIDELLASLSPRQARILELRFGLHGEDAHTRESMAPIFGVTRDRIRQLETSTLKEIREKHSNLLSKLEGLDIF